MEAISDPSAHETDASGTRVRERHFPLARTAPLAYVAVLLGSAFAAYWAMFSEFAPYDDSGYFIHSIRLFSEGQALYDRVFTDYGPFSYELWAAVFGITGRALTTDGGRLATVAVWLLTSLLLGVSAQRLTGRLALGVIVQVLSFSVLTALNAEPMHASGVVCALFAAIVAVVAFVLPNRQRVALAALGGLVAALALTKINIGGFAVIAVAFSAVMALPSLARIAPLRWLTVTGFVFVGPILMLSNLNDQWAQNYSILAVGGSLAVVLAASSDLPTSAFADDAREWITWLLIGAVACAVVVLGIVFALGTSPGALWQEIVVVPTHQGEAFTIPISLTDDVVYWAVGAVGAAWVVYRLRARPTRVPGASPIGGVLRVVAAIAIWFSIVSADPLNISPENANFALAMVLAWIAAVPPASGDWSVQQRFVRLLLPSLAVLEALMAYPVAGAQVMFGSLLFVVCGALCFADGWRELESWGVARSVGPYTARSIMIALSAVLAVALAFQYVVRPIQFWGDAYATNPSLPIAGATRLHLPAARVNTYAQINVLLRSRCHSVITLPGMLSFNLWSGLPAPSGLTAEPFWHLLSPAQERTALASAEAAPALCAVRNDEQAASWGNGKPPPKTPLVAFIEQDFTPIAQYEGYVVGVRRQ